MLKLQREIIRHDYRRELQTDGSIQFRANWLSGPSLDRIENCRIISLHGDMRANVYVNGEPDAIFIYPATCSILGKVIRGHITSDSLDDKNCLVFYHDYK